MVVVVGGPAVEVEVRYALEAMPAVNEALAGIVSMVAANNIKNLSRGLFRSWSFWLGELVQAAVE